MQLKQIARDALLKPLQAVSGIVERRHTLPILANVLLEQKNGKLHVTATDLEMQITAVSDMDGKDGQATTVGARKLQDLLRALPDDAQINLDASGSKMTVRAGRSRFNLQTLAAGDYPRISVGQEQLQTLALRQRDFRALLKLAEFAMAQQDIRYYLNGMLLVVDQASLQAVATDGHRLSWASIAIDGNYGIEANAFAFHSRTASFPEAGVLPNLGYFIDAKFSLPIFDWGARRSASRISRQQTSFRNTRGKPPLPNALCSIRNVWPR